MPTELPIREELPPNYELIRMVLSPKPGAIFSYGGIIYNPHKRDIAPDLHIHEAVHARQQGDNPDAWWARYLQDPEFRLEQELEAYGEQYAFAKEHIEAQAQKAAEEGKVLAAGKTQLLRYALESMAFALSGEEYGNLISYSEAASKIRNWGR